MTDITENLIVQVLKKYHPELLCKIKDQLTHTIPDGLTDTSLIPGFIDQMLELKKVDPGKLNWNSPRGSKVMGINPAGDAKLYLVSDLRTILVGVIVYLYEPSKLLGFKDQRMKTGILQTYIDHTGNNPVPVYKSVNSAIAFYKHYIDFKNELNYLRWKLCPEYFTEPVMIESPAKHLTRASKQVYNEASTDTSSGRFDERTLY